MFRKDKIRRPMFTKVGAVFQCFRDKITILMFNKIGAEFHCLIKQGQNQNVRKDKIRIPTFKKIGADFKCREGYNLNKRDRIPMLGRIRSECQCLIKNQGQNSKGQNSSASKDKVRIPISKKKSSNERKDMVRVAMFTKIGPEFQCQKG